MVWSVRVKYDDPKNQLVDKNSFSAAIQSVVTYMNKCILGTTTLDLTVKVWAYGGIYGNGGVANIGKLGDISIAGPVAAKELQSGQDSNGGNADLTIYMDPSSDIFQRSNVDTQPFDSPTVVPKTDFDMQTIILHEIMHGLGITGYRDFTTGQYTSSTFRSVWDLSTEVSGNSAVLNMPTFSAHGIAPVHLTITNATANYYHVGNKTNTTEGYVNDVMSGRGSLPGFRIGLSKLDLYILENLGYSVTIPEGLPLSFQGRYVSGQTMPTLVNDFGASSYSTNVLTLQGKAAPSVMSSVIEHSVVLGSTTADANGNWTLKVFVDPSVTSSTLYVRDGVNVVDSPAYSISRSSADLVLNASTTFPQVVGAAGNDRLVPGNENDALDGGAGVDTAVFARNRADFTVLKTSSGFKVTDKVGLGGVDTLTNVERITFNEGTIALSLEGVAATPTLATYTALAQEFYVAYFGRPADPGGLQNMVGQLISGNVPSASADALVAVYGKNQTVTSIIDSFGNSAESAALYNGNNRDFVRAIYGNMLGRAPDAEGLEFWTGAIDSGNLGRGLVALTMLAGARKNVTPQGLIDGALVANRIVVASNFTASLDTPSEQVGYRGNAAAAIARAMLGQVTSNTSIVDYQSQVGQTIVSLGQAHSSGEAPIVLIGIPAWHA